MANEQNLRMFEKGNPGGPGRPKGSKSLSTILRTLLESEIPMKDPKTGEIVQKTGAEALGLSIFRTAMKGNVNAWREVADRTEGKAVQKMELTGADGEAIKNETKISRSESDQAIIDEYYKRRKEQEQNG